MKTPRKPKPTIPVPVVDITEETMGKPLGNKLLNLAKGHGKGAIAYSDKTLHDVMTQPLVKKGELTRGKWAETAYILALRSKRAAQSFSKKDFNALYRLVLSAGIAFDKAFPQVVQPLNGNLVVQLFGSLGADTAKAILEPPHPTIDITPLSLPSQVGVPDSSEDHEVSST